MKSSCYCVNIHCYTAVGRNIDVDGKQGVSYFYFWLVIIVKLYLYKADLPLAATITFSLLLSAFYYALFTAQAIDILPHYHFAQQKSIYMNNNYDLPQSDLSRGVLGGLFAGIVATVINLVFVYAYRYATGFEDFNGMDVMVIICGSILQSITCGLIFYWFVHYLNKGMLYYRVVVLMITIAIVYLGLTFRQTLLGSVPYNFRVIVITTQVVIGGLATFLIPYLFRHDSIIS